MDRETQEKLFEEIKGYVAQGTTKLVESEMEYPAGAYYDPGHLAREKRLMARFPQIVGHSDDLANPGDFIANNVVGVPFIVVRQKDGGLKAFHNVCSHRGASVCDKAKGNTGQFFCRFHAWTYNLDGSLKFAPSAGFPTLDKENARLTELCVDERHGLIWLQLDEIDGIDISAHLDALDKEIGGLGIGDCVLHRSEVLDADINWKSVLDGFLEVYHFATLHADSIGPYFYGNLAPFDQFGLNGRLVGVRKAFDDIADKPFDEAKFLPAVAVNYHVFPNTIIVWQGDHFEIWTSFPGDVPGKCKVLVQMLIPRDAYSDETLARWDRNYRIMIDTVVKEDWSICQEAQNSLPHIANDRMYFGANEPGLQHFHGNMSKALAHMN